MSCYRAVFIAVMVATALNSHSAWPQVHNRIIDSLKRRLMLTPADTNRTRLLLQIGQLYYDHYKVDRQDRSYSDVRKQPDLLDSAIGYARQVVGLPVATYQLPQKAEALYLLAECYSFGESYDSIRTISYYQQALKAFKQVGSKPRTARVLHSLANIVRLRIGAQQALPLFMEELAIQQSYRDTTIYLTLERIGFLHQTMGNYQLALQAYQQSLRLAEHSNNLSYLEDIYADLAMIYETLGDYQAAITILKKRLGIESPKAINQVAGDHIRLLNLYKITHQLPQARQQALTIIELARQDPNHESINLTSYLAQSYVFLGQYERAEPLYKHLFPIYEKSNNFTGLTNFNKHVGELYWLTRRFEQARYFYQIALTASQQGRFPDEAVSIHRALFQIDSAQGNLRSALQHFQLATAINDSLFNQTKNRQFEELRTQYETEQKDKDLHLQNQRIQVLSQQQQLQTQQSQQDRLVRNSIGLGAFMLLLLLGLTYNRYRLKQRSNQQLQHQHELLQAQQHQLQAQHQELQAHQQVLHTQQNQIHHKNQDLQRLLDEQERLMKEIHHRVKNNLQVVMSLLNSQASYLSDNAALSAIQQSQHRVQAMALIHQKLYQAQGIARIRMDDYIQEVVAYLQESYELPQPIGFAVQVEPIELDVIQAVPLGLIINEAITNALKYAFPNGRTGRVSLGFMRMGETSYELTIQDDGVGLPPDFDPSRSQSLGMTLIQGFSDQLGGQLSIISQAGLTIQLTFSEKELTSFGSHNHYGYH
ncbi:tetratricopeptide repeat-containing sensor histidine kinase [Spirosoma endbachense]|uniref:histidine kinase n=1 Tax=Spirosoma endbachense TaxID=2666025 RepID=A0A6P1W405_9BACT|nr:histidine kinase dimerization/phosphoacceptor domain -containing protein [Spirosoma endbachense]QHV98680.1 tetratricopeptide repeat protein [Spirosoma endbachense]